MAHKLPKRGSRVNTHKTKSTPTKSKSKKKGTK